MKGFQIVLLLILVLLILLGTQYQKFIDFYNAITGAATGRTQSVWDEYWAALDARDFEKAEDLLDEIKNDPYSQPGWGEYAELYYYSYIGDYDEALDLAKNQQYTLEYRDNYGIRGWLYQQTHDLDNALDDYTYLIDNYGSNREQALGSAWETAFDAIKLNRADEFEEVLQREYPDTPYAIETEYRIAYIKRDFDAANAEVERIRALASTSDEGSDGMKLAESADFYEADLLAIQGYEDEARALIEKAGVTQTDAITRIHWQLYFADYFDNSEMVKYYAIEGLLESCAAEIIEELGLEIPEELAGREEKPGPVYIAGASKYLGDLAGEYISEGNLELAQRCVEKSLALSPYCESALTASIDILKISGNTAGAIDEMNRVLEMAPYEYQIRYNYKLLSLFDPDALGENDPNPDKIFKRTVDSAKSYLEAFPDSVYGNWAVGACSYMMGEDYDPQMLLKPYEWSHGDPHYVLLPALVTLDSDGLEAAKELVRSSEMIHDLEIFTDIYFYAGAMAEKPILDLADWMRSEYDPDGDFDQYLDGLRQQAIERVNSGG